MVPALEADPVGVAAILEIYVKVTAAAPATAKYIPGQQKLR